MSLLFRLGALSLLSLTGCSLFFSLLSHDECTQSTCSEDGRTSLFCSQGQLFEINCGENLCNEVTNECNQVCGDDFVQLGEECDPPGSVNVKGTCNQACRFTPVCGDNKINPPEQCDDGNTAPGDGCNPNCFLEFVLEFEPNDSATFITGYPGRPTDGFDPGLAQGASRPFTKDVIIAGTLQVGSVPNTTKGTDVYALQNNTAAPVTLRLDTFSASISLSSLGQPCSESVATLVLRDKDGTIVQSGVASDLQNDLCEGLTATIPAGETFYAQLSVPDGLIDAPAYFLYVDFNPTSTTCGDGILGGLEECEPPGTTFCDNNCKHNPTCGDNFIDSGEGERCDDGNLLNDDGCSDGCALENATNNTLSANLQFPTEVTADSAFLVGLDSSGSFALLKNSSATQTNNVRISLFRTDSIECFPGANLLFPKEDLFRSQDIGVLFQPLLQPSCTVLVRTLAPGQEDLLSPTFPNPVVLEAGGELRFDFMPCGDGVLEVGEECEPSLGPGCTASCRRAPVCGDGIFAAPEEQCDDENTQNNDGCDSSCQIENLRQESEFDDTPISEDVVIEGIIAPPGLGIDTYELRNPSASNAVVRVERFAHASGMGRPCESFEMTGGAALGLGYRNGVTSFEGCDANAVLLGPNQSLSVTVFAPSNPAIDDLEIPYLLQVRFSECGDGVLELGEECEGPNTAGCNAECQAIAVCGDGLYDFPEEQCDDGNTQGGDACPAACIVVEGALAELEPNDRFLGPRQTFSQDAVLVGDASVDAENETDTYLLRNTTSGPVGVRLDLFTLGADLSTACGDASLNDYTFSFIAGQNNSAAPCTSLIATLFPGTERSFFISKSPSITFEPYIITLEFSVCGNGEVEFVEDCEPPNSVTCDAGCQRIPLCGDGILDFPEGCDDGNTNNGDVCAANCDPFNVFAESEPNDDGTPSSTSALNGGDFSSANANGPFSTNTVVLASINPIGDEDIFAVTNPSTNPVSVRLDTFDANLGLGVLCDSFSADSVLNVRDAAGNLLAQNDERGVGDHCSGLAFLLSPGQSIFAQVLMFNENRTFDAYLLQMSFTPVVCGDSIVAPGEECDDGNLSSGDGCSADCAVIEAGFVCQPGSCRSIICGDTLVDPGESCDDGNLIDEDGCSSLCQIEGSGFDCVAGQTLLQIAATDVPKSIPDNNPAGVTSTLNVADNRTIKRVIVAVESLTHTFDADLQILLVSPSGTEVLIFNKRGNGSDNLTNTIFDDACVSLNGPIAGGVAPFTGCFSPDTSLSTLNNQAANGAWRLKIIDTFNADTGTLNAWTLGLCVQ